MKRIPLIIIIALFALSLLTACAQVDQGIISQQNSAGKTETAEEVDPQGTSQISSETTDYEIVFPQDAVNEITITISPANWQVMREDMTELYGEGGSGGGLGASNRPGFRPADGERPPGPEGTRPQDGSRNQQPGPGGPGKGIMGGNDDQNPIWVEAEITFQGQSWDHVGIRYKGNSSLRSTWSAGSLKLPFKLDFDQFEDQYPESEDQRFYSFKQLSFASNFHDDSYLREKIAADLFREAGVPAAQTAFYAVTVDYGEGPVYLGLYTAVEVIDDTLIETQFKYDGGNVYKPEGTGATFAEGSFSEASFDKETNQEQDDYDDILALFDALHSETRTSDPATWRRELEAVFDVDTFLNWLAVNTVIQNWDTYGVMNHNYYLYNNPDTGQLVWIPWDNNESLKSSGGVRDPLGLDLSRVGEDWPLISYLRDDPVYYHKYLSYLEAFLGQVLLKEDLVQTFHYYHDLIAGYAQQEDPQHTMLTSRQAFETSVDVLIQHINSRIELTEKYLE